MPDRRVVHTEEAPAAIGPYSQAVVAGGFVFTAGQIALHPRTGDMVGGGDVAAESEQALDNLNAVLTAAGSGLAHVVRCDVYVADMDDFGTVNAVYGRYFEDAPPARITVQAARLPKDARVEIAAIARVP
ncbi:MAG: Rid family detoxifying hydrolase [Planctomycetota bacterium]|jgi:2-iminobutanoate/2-iminopropanoate deaminase